MAFFAAGCLCIHNTIYFETSTECRSCRGFTAHMGQNAGNDDLSYSTFVKIGFEIRIEKCVIRGFSYDLLLGLRHEILNYVRIDLIAFDIIGEESAQHAQVAHPAVTVLCKNNSTIHGAPDLKQSGDLRYDGRAGGKVAATGRM